MGSLSRFLLPGLSVPVAYTSHLSRFWHISGISPCIIPYQHCRHFVYKYYKYPSGGSYIHHHLTIRDASLMQHSLS